VDFEGGVRAAYRAGRTLDRCERAPGALSGPTKCGVCGSGFVLSSRNRLACFGARDQGTCSNHFAITRQEVEARVLAAMRDKLLRHDLFEEFCREFTREIRKVIEAIKDREGDQAG
jgi:site-specific DNA recombinase